MIYDREKHKITCKAAEFWASGRDLGKIMKKFQKNY